MVLSLVPHSSNKNLRFDVIVEPFTNKKSQHFKINKDQN